MGAAPSWELVDEVSCTDSTAWAPGRPTALVLSRPVKGSSGQGKAARRDHQKRRPSSRCFHSTSPAFLSPTITPVLSNSNRLALERRFFEAADLSGKPRRIEILRSARANAGISIALA